MSKLYQLPDGWELRELKTVCTFINGRAYKQAELLSDGKYPVLRVGNFFTNNSWYYSDLELPRDKYCDQGDLLYAWSASFGPKIWDGVKSIFHYHIWKIEPDYSAVTKLYLYWLLYWDVNQIKADFGSGTTMIHVTKGAIESRKVPLPPIPEQKRIVQKLDALFERVDKAIALLQKNIAAADNFMNSVLNDVFSDLEQNHSSRAIKLFAHVGTGVTPLKTNQAYYDNGTINWITSKFTGEPYVNKADELITALALNECRLTLNPIGTLIVALYGQGKTRGQVSELMIEAATNQAVATILVDNSKCINKYLKWYFKKSYLELREKSNGGTQQNLNLSIIKSTLVPLPEDLSIQQKIVAYLEGLSIQIEQVKSAQQQKMQNLLGLKLSILDQAFHGKL